ncbi:MAG: hypothetical protein KME57_01655 [Scytonema hyalinum WJT4-NPBG1]|nr:hypothetical protein [Scytonema hyalinum WJT4-NPBG1]
MILGSLVSPLHHFLLTRLFAPSVDSPDQMNQSRKPIVRGGKQATTIRFSYDAEGSARSNTLEI